MKIPGLEGEGETPSARREWLAALPEDELAERLVDWVVRMRTIDVDTLARWAGLPPAEVRASPFGIRAIGRATRRGVTSVHRELRRVLPAPVASNVADPDHGVWDRGVLRIGKYQAFVADAPFATYDPAHLDKWAPHEMMHRALGFFWRRDATRWELYLGARLNELVPVALWYGFDQLARDWAKPELEVGALFDRTAARSECPAPWWSEDATSLEERVRADRASLAWGLQHVATELDAVDAERRTGSRVRTIHRVPNARLDASSDATAYVVAHADRLDAMAEMLEHTPATASVDAYRQEVEVELDALLFGDFDATPVEGSRESRRRWDLMHRAAWLGTFDSAIDYDDFAALDDDVIANGELGQDLAQLADGVASVAPSSLDHLDLDAFAESSAVLGRAPLGERLCRFVDDGPVADLLVLERAIADVREDDAMTHLGAASGSPVRSETARLVVCDHDVLPMHAGAAPGPGPSRYLVLAHDGEVHVLELDDALAAAWSHPEEADAKLVRALVEAGALRLAPLPD